jgi:hypothetical protein
MAGREEWTSDPKTETPSIAKTLAFTHLDVSADELLQPLMGFQRRMFANYPPCWFCQKRNGRGAA